MPDDIKDELRYQKDIFEPQKCSEAVAVTIKPQELDIPASPAKEPYTPSEIRKHFQGQMRRVKEIDPGYDADAALTFGMGGGG